MAKRPKIFYPAYQITNGLFTKGKQWMYATTKKEYVGPYHRYTDGLVMTGGSYSEATSEYLIPYEDVSKNPSKTIYDDIRKGDDVRRYVAPKHYYPLNDLTIDDYKREYFDRYFVKRTNDATARIIEINKQQYNTLNSKGSGINGSLYYGLTIRWKISGPQESYYRQGVKVYGVAEANRTTLLSNEQKMPGITNFLGDFLEFSIYSKLIDESILVEISKG